MLNRSATFPRIWRTLSEFFITSNIPPPSRNMSLLWGDIFSRWGLPLCLPDNIFKWFGVPTYIFNFIFPYSFLQFVRVNFDNAIFETILIQNFSSKMSLTFSKLTKHKKACFNRIIRRSVINDRIELSFLQSLLHDLTLVGVAGECSPASFSCAHLSRCSQ